MTKEEKILKLRDMLADNAIVCHKNEVDTTPVEESCDAIIDFVNENFQ